MIQPKIIRGKLHEDNRGSLYYNNEFKLDEIKRIYEIKNSNTELNRGWKGHIIEDRWFLCSFGSIQISIKSISKSLIELNKSTISIVLNSNTFDVLYVPKGFATSIKQIKKNSKITVFSNYSLNHLDDHLRWDEVNGELCLKNKIQ